MHRAGVDGRRHASSPVGVPPADPAGGAVTSTPTVPPVALVKLPGGDVVAPDLVRAVTGRGDSTRVYLRTGPRSHLTVPAPMTAVLACLAAAS